MCRQVVVGVCVGTPLPKDSRGLADCDARLRWSHWHCSIVIIISDSAIDRDNRKRVVVVAVNKACRGTERYATNAVLTDSIREADPGAS